MFKKVSQSFAVLFIFIGLAIGNLSTANAATKAKQTCEQKAGKKKFKSKKSKETYIKKCKKKKAKKVRKKSMKKSKKGSTKKTKKTASKKPVKKQAKLN